MFSARNIVVCAAIACAPMLTACREDIAGLTEPPLPDRAMFEATIYPMLMRDCGFSECHGARQRFFQVFGPGRSRLEGHPSDPDLAPRERQRTYDRARSMLVFPGGSSVLESPLLTKPLEIAAGGASHEGVDRFGRNVFQSMADPRYLMLLQWAGYWVPPPTAAPAPAPLPAPVPGAPTGTVAVPSGSAEVQPSLPEEPDGVSVDAAAGGDEAAP